MANEEELATFLGFVGGLKDYELQKAREEYQKKFDEDIKKLLNEAMENNFPSETQISPRGVSPLISIMEKLEAENGSRFR